MEVFLSSLSWESADAFMLKKNPKKLGMVISYVYILEPDATNSLHSNTI